MNRMRGIAVLLFLALFAGGEVNDVSAEQLSGSGPAHVEIRGEPGNYRLFRNGLPYRIRGAGGTTHLEMLRDAGANSIRTWHVGDGSILDQAQALGLTVSLCLDIARERHGFDYDDDQAVRAQFERAREAVLKYRNHPALLTWIIGNELNFNYENPRVFDAVNDISKMIHELDPYHPTTTTTAGIDSRVLEDIRQRAPDLDFISIQVYGGLAVLPEMIESLDIEMPIMVTEWGTVGHWEVDETAWGAPIELDSAAKAAHYREGYEQKLEPLAGRVIGDYMFLWGQKQERTPTWYGVLTPDGSKTEAIDTLQYLWTGEWPAERAPHFVSMSLDGRTAADSVQLESGQRVSASVSFQSLDGDAVTVEWQLMEESDATEVGGDPEAVPQAIEGAIDNPGSATIRLTAPAKPGPYRLFAYGRDDDGATAHGNIPFLVIDR